MTKELIYTEHYAGSYEDGLQICIHCGKVICDYTGEWLSSNGSATQGFPEGEVFVTGSNPVQWTSIKPLENYGGNDPFIRKVIKCVQPVK